MATKAFEFPFDVRKGEHRNVFDSSDKSAGVFTAGSTMGAA